MTDAVQKILSWYESDNPGVKTNLARLLYHGKLGGTGKLIILPVDQGFEHGPDRCFVPNPPAYDPHSISNWRSTPGFPPSLRRSACWRPARPPSPAAFR